MLTREQKKKIVQDLVQELQSAKGAVFSDFQGLKSRDVQELRSRLRQEDVRHKVVKITLLKKALKQAGIDTSRFDYHVPVAVSVSREDEVAPARLLESFAKKHEKLKVLAGVLDQKFIDMAAVKKLAALPGKLELRGQLVGVIAAPLRGLVGVLNGSLRQLVYVLSAIKESKS